MALFVVALVEVFRLVERWRISEKIIKNRAHVDDLLAHNFP